MTEIQCIYDKNKKALQTVITYDDSEQMYEELRQFSGNMEEAWD